MKLNIAGGCGEHGRNCFHVEGEQIQFLVDCGVMADEASGGYPKLEPSKIRTLQCLFLTHSHADHTGAIPWLWHQWFTGAVIATRATLEQLPYSIDNAFALEELCPGGIGEYCGILIKWGYSGHCIGSVWYQLTIEGKTILFTGDYIEESQAYQCMKIRGQRADLAVIDCAYGRDNTSYEEACDKLVLETKALLEEKSLLLFPVPKNGRGIELLALFQKAGLTEHYYGDQHFINELVRQDLYQSWYKPMKRNLLSMVKPYQSQSKRGIVFISNPQLRNSETRKLANEVLLHGYGVMTGTVDKDGYSHRLIQEGKMKLIRYPVHQNHMEYERLKKQNEFVKAIPYHTIDYMVEDTICI